jgi:hypothetical protein
MLHVQLINAADTRDERDKKASMALRKCQGEINDLKFINKQLLSRIEGDARKLEGEKARMGQVLEQLGLSLGQEVDSKLLKLNPPSKLINFVPRIDIDTGLGKGYFLCCCPLKCFIYSVVGRTGKTFRLLPSRLPLLCGYDQTG